MNTSEGILRKNANEETKAEKRLEAEKRLVRIIEDSLHGKSEEFKIGFLYEIEQYIKNGGIEQYLNMATRENNGNGMNGNGMNGNGINYNMNDNMNDNMKGRRSKAMNNVRGKNKGNRKQNGNTRKRKQSVSRSTSKKLRVSFGPLGTKI